MVWPEAVVGHDRDSRLGHVELDRGHLRGCSDVAMDAWAGREGCREGRLCRLSHGDASDACDRDDAGSGLRIVGAVWRVLAGGHEEAILPRCRCSTRIQNLSFLCQ